MASKEKSIINDLILNAGKFCRLFRANAGMAWTGKIVEQTANYIKLKNPRPFHGLPKGFSDVFGLESITITQDMVGKKIAVFKAIEVKTGKIPLTDKQKKFGKMVEKLGGFFEVVRG